jgi:hypothetical protein
MNKVLIISSIFLSSFLAAMPTSAKRLAPEFVPPVVVNSIEYSAPHDAMGFVVATDIATRKELWRKRIYSIRIDPALEEDVQWVFIKSLVMENGELIVISEDGNSFTLNPATQSVTKRK